MLKSEDKIKDKLELQEKIKDRKFESLDKGRIPEENIPRAFLRFGDKYQKIGLYKLALGRCGDAIPDFGQSAEWYYKGAQETRTRRDSLSDDFEGGARLLKYLYSAILSGEERRLEQATTIAFETAESHYHHHSTEFRYHFMTALAAEIQDTEDQRGHLDSLATTFEALPDDHRQYFGALHGLLTGIVDRDEQAFDDGVDEFLHWHDDNVDFENRTSADDLVCLPVTALLVLARRKGMDAHVESPYVPEYVDELV